MIQFKNDFMIAMAEYERDGPKILENKRISPNHYRDLEQKINADRITITQYKEKLQREGKFRKLRHIEREEEIEKKKIQMQLSLLTKNKQ